MTDPNHWVIGHGLLGSALVRRVRPDRSWTPPSAIAWTEPLLAIAQLREAARQFLSAADDGPWRVSWCAGIGTVGATPSALRDETSALQAVLREITARARSRGRFFYSSSAGAVYAGSPDPPFTESSPCIPVSPYGHSKVIQEQMVRAWAVSSGIDAIIGRISNLYGPGQDFAKPQGVVTQLCRSCLLREPMTIYVPLQTVRDYLYVDDCAAMILALLDDEVRPTDRQPVMRILASGQPTTLGSLIQITARVVKRQPRIVQVPSILSQGQVHDLRLRSEHMPTRPSPGTGLPTGVKRTFDDLLRTFQRGTPWA